MSRLCALFVATSILFYTTALSTVNRYMTHYDLTRDGKVDSRELRTVAYMNHKLPPTISDNIFRKADRNGDKFIDHVEIVAAARLIQRHVAEATLHWLEDHDTDGDGLLSEAELFESIYMEHGLSATDISGCFRESDVNRDNHLTFSELVGTLHCSRLLALKEAKELLKIYDSDGDHRLNIQEAQVLAQLRYDIGPSYATIIFADVNHREDHMINELELIDFLTKLREEAATTALNKLSSFDQNGDKAISFSELLQGYEKQLKKSVLKKIFSKVDVNKNVHIDPIEFISLENLIADEIRLQAIQNDSEQKYSTTEKATTFLPALIIFSPSKNKPNHQSSKQRKRRSAPEADTKLMISDQSKPGIRELTASNASSVHFSTVVTAVPKFLKSGEDYQKLLSDGAQMMSELFTNSERAENKNVNEANDVKKIQYKSISDENISPLTPQKDNEFTSAVNERSRIDENGRVGKQNGAPLTNEPNMVHVKKFEKFFNFLQKAIKKISEAVKENNEKQEDLKSPLRSINIIKHSSHIPNNNLNIEVNETTKLAAAVTQKPITIPTTTEKLKIKKNMDNTIHEKIRNEKDLIVHTPIDETKYKTVTSEKFNGLFSASFLQFNEDEDGDVKMINYGGTEHAEVDKHNLHSVVKTTEETSEDVDERDCTLEHSPNLDSSSAQSAKSMKQHKCNRKIRKSNGINTELLQKISMKSKKIKLPSESNKESENQSSSISNKIHSENESDETANKIIANVESDETFDANTKRINFNATSKDEFKNAHDKFIHQSLHSQLTAKDDKSIHNELDSTRAKKVSAKTKGRKLQSSRSEVNVSEEKSTDEFEPTALALAVDQKPKEYEIPELFSSQKESVADKNDQKIRQKLQKTNSQKPLQLLALKSQIAPSTTSKEDEFFDEILNDILNAKVSELHQTVISNAAKSKQHMKNDSRKNTKLSLKLKNNDTVLQVSEIPIIATSLPTISSSAVTTSSSSSEISPSITTATPEHFSTITDNLSDDTVTTSSSSSEISPSITTASPEHFSTITDNISDDTVTTMETSVLPNYTNKQISEVQANSTVVVEIESDKSNQTSVTSDITLNSTTYLANDNDTRDVNVRNTDITRLSDAIFSAERRMKNDKVTDEHSAEIAIIQKKRKKHSRHPEKKSPNENDISVEVNNSTVNTTDLIASKKKLQHERRRLKKKYQSKICANDQRCTSSSSQSTKTTESVDLNLSQKNDTELFHQNFEQNRSSKADDWRRQKTDDLLLRVVQEYQAYLRNQEKAVQN